LAFKNKNSKNSKKPETPKNMDYNEDFQHNVTYKRNLKIVETEKGVILGHVNYYEYDYVRKVITENCKMAESLLVELSYIKKLKETSGELVSIADINQLSFVESNRRYSVALDVIEDLVNNYPDILTKDVIGFSMPCENGELYGFAYKLEDIISALKEVFGGTLLYYEMDFVNFKSVNKHKTKHNVFEVYNGYHMSKNITLRISLPNEEEFIYVSLGMFESAGLVNAYTNRTNLEDEVSCYNNITFWHNVNRDILHTKMDELINFLNKCDVYQDYVEENKSNPTFFMIKQTQAGFSLDKMKSESSADFPLDLHYGKDFIEFDKRLRYTLKVKDKGLVFFRGETGSGKTHYIKYLSAALKDTHMFIMMKPSLFKSFDNPVFQEFISETVLNSTKKVVLVIEDAESLIAERGDNHVRSSDMSILLNFTDGIDSELYPMQIILSFNADINKIDRAAKRDGRLIADKQFNKLDVNTAKKLFNHIVEKRHIESNVDVNQLINEDVVVATVYRLIDEQDPNILNGFTETETSKNKIGLKLG
jgi:hypothetical protein